MRTNLRFAGAAVLLLAAALLLGPAAAADDEPAPAPAPAPGDDAKEPGPPTPERPDVTKLYVPFRDLEKIFQKEGEGVFLPYKEFRRLWELAHRLPEDTTKPPVPQYSGSDHTSVASRRPVVMSWSFWQKTPARLSAHGYKPCAPSVGWILSI